MKRTNIDKLGRIVIPISYRRALGITEETPLIVEFENTSVRITPFIDSCKICNAKIEHPKSVPLCEECIYRIKNL